MRARPAGLRLAVLALSAFWLALVLAAAAAAQTKSPPPPAPLASARSTLDIAKPGERILMVSYGSGAGSDGFVFTVTDRINEVRDVAPKTREMLDTNKHYIEYGMYAKYRGKIKKIAD